jgi:dipeptidyl aminopeptidase/acylaminoacyl peptidase
MICERDVFMRRIPGSLLLLCAAALGAADKRPMTPLDVLQFRTVEGGTLSRDGKRFAYMVGELDWKAGRRVSELYYTELGRVTRRMTFTAVRSESQPAFSPDGQHLAFLSDRETASAAGSGQERRSQLYLIAVAGGEARKISDVPSGAVTSFEFSRDGKWIAFRAGRADSSQVYLYNLETGKADALTREAAGVTQFRWASDSSRVFFTSPDERSENERRRMDLRFDVKIVDAPKQPEHLWEIAIGDRKTRRLTSGREFTVTAFSVSRDGNSIGFTGSSPNRYQGGLDGIHFADAYLLDVASGSVERLTRNHVPESLPLVSPDGKWVAISSPDEFIRFHGNRAYLRPRAGGAWKKLPNAGQEDVGGLMWSADSRKLFYTAGVGLNQHLFSIDAESGEVRQLTDRVGALAVSYAPDCDRFVLTAEDPKHPRDYYIAQRETLSSPAQWTRVSDANPNASDFALGDYETVRWTSSDGRTVEGILIKPAGYRPGTRYPLIVQVHGGPAGAYLNSFSSGWGTYVHVFAAGGYAVFQPNYRGSTNYGDKFRTEIAGDYFRQGFDDIMTGVDELIRRGIADPDKLGLMGWSAGGHWANWTLTHSDRFKAISSGAGAVNWISMYGQTDVHEIRDFYFKGAPWENWDQYLNLSPLKYIRNAKTPTLIQVGQEDARVPRPQSEELHMALKKLGVPTEFIVYPRMGHGITEPRYQMVKMTAEYNWFEKWIKGKPGWFDWKDILNTVPK